MREPHDNDGWDSYLTAIGLNPESNIIASDTMSSSVTGGNSSHHKTNGTTAALIVVSTAFIGLVIAIVIYGMYKYKKNRSRSGYGNLEITTNTDMEQNTDV